MSVQIDTETAALTEEKRVFAAMQEFVDPKTYDGRSRCGCLIGQTAKGLDGLDFPRPVVRIVADHFGVSDEIIAHIFCRAGGPSYAEDYGAAMQMAAEELGLTPTGKEERCRE